MSNLGKTFGKKTAKKTAKVTARHSLRGVKSKAKRDPLRTSTLLGAGGAIGALAGFVLGRRTG